MKTHFKWMVLAIFLIFIVASVGMVSAQQKRDEVQRWSEPKVPPTQPMGEEAERTIYGVLAKEHNRLKDLLGKIGESKDAQNTSRLMAQLQSVLVPHLKAEEKEVYPEFEKYDKTKSLALQTGMEHKIIERILKEIVSTKGDNPKFQASFNVLNQSIRTHIRNEEGPFFSAARDVLSDEQARQLAQSYLAAEIEIASAFQQMPKAG